MQKPGGYGWNGSTPMRKGWLQLRRLGRACFWHDPALYRWVGRLRGRGDCRNLDFDIWIDGFPGSASVLSAALFQKANPAARVAGRRHLPPFILNALHHFKPGMFLVSPPEEAVISLAVLSHNPLGECLDYYNDFHRALRSNAPWLFTVTPAQLMSQFDTVMEVFNLHFQTNFAVPSESLADAISARDKPLLTRPDVAAGELRVTRPAASRGGARQELRQRLHASPALRRKLEAARQLYSMFVPDHRKAPLPSLNLSTRHLPTLA